MRSDGGDTVPDGEPRALRRFGVTFCGLEAVGGLAWWIALALSPELRHSFFPAPIDGRWFGALALADGVLFVGSAGVAAIALARRSPRTLAALWLHAGICGYAGLLAVGLWVQDPGLWLGALLMLPSLLVPAVLAWRLERA